MRRGATHRQLARFGLVGAASNGVLYLVFLLLTAAGMGPKLAMSLLYALGVIQTFMFNKRWSFRHEGAEGLAFARYCIVYGLGYVLNFLGLYWFVDKMHISYWMVQGVMIIVVSAFIFLMQKFWVFQFPSSMEETRNA